MAELPSTGNEAVDALQELQCAVSQLPDPDMKRARVQEACATLPTIRDMLGGRFGLKTLMTFGKRPEAPAGELILFSGGLSFKGTFEAIGYMHDNELPVDSLTLHFDEPEIDGSEPADLRAFRKLQLRVPVLAVAACVSLPTETT